VKGKTAIAFWEVKGKVAIAFLMYNFQASMIHYQPSGDRL
jgi:hypothetical protein